MAGPSKEVGLFTPPYVERAKRLFVPLMQVVLQWTAEKHYKLFKAPDVSK